MIRRCLHQNGPSLCIPPNLQFRNPAARTKFCFYFSAKLSSFNDRSAVVFDSPDKGTNTKSLEASFVYQSAKFTPRAHFFSFLSKKIYHFLNSGKDLQTQEDEELSKNYDYNQEYSQMTTAPWKCLVSRLKDITPESAAFLSTHRNRKRVFISMVGVVCAVLKAGWSSVKGFCYFLQASFLSLLNDTNRGVCTEKGIHFGQLSLITGALYHQPGGVDATLSNLGYKTGSLPQISNLGYITGSIPRISYMMDVLFERHPVSYLLLLVLLCCVLICIGAFFFSKYRSYKQAFEDSIWDAWACICSTSTHLRERTFSERVIGLMLAIGGLLSYSILTSTMTTQFKSRLDWLREGAHSQVMENGHIVICGTNNHLTTVLKQLNKSQELTIKDALTLPRKQTVLLLSELERKDLEKMISHVFKDCPQLNILTRSGSLSSTVSFQNVAADKARSVIILASNDDRYQADAESVLTVLALQPLLSGSSGKLFVEVFNSSTADLLRSYSGMDVHPLQNLSSKIFVQCSRQPGLIEVYQELLDHGRQVINLRSYQELAGIHYRDVRKGFPGAVVCGLIRRGKVNFHPKDEFQLEESDKLLIISPKGAYKNAPKVLVAMKSQKVEIGHKNASATSSTTSVRTHMVSSVGKKDPKAADWQIGPKECILILGWHPCVVEIVNEYDDYVGPGSELVILSEVPVEKRKRAMDCKLAKPLQNANVRQQVGNPMSREDLKKAILDIYFSNLKTWKSSAKSTHKRNKKFPLSIVSIADKAYKSGDISRPDKQSLFALLLAENICKECEVEVASLVAKFVDTELGRQVVKLRSNLTFIGTDEITGLVTAQVADQSELNDVWTELLNSWGNEIYMKDIRRYLKPGESASFAELSERAILCEEVAIGYRLGGNTVINPPLTSASLTCTLGDSLVVISEFEYNSVGL